MVKATGPVVGLMRTEPTAARGARRRVGGASAAVRVSAFSPEAPLVAPDESVRDEATAESDLLPLETRPVRLVDLAGLRRVDDVHRLNQPETQLVPYSPLRAGMAAAMPGFRARRPFFVASAGERLVGYAHFSPVPPDQRWHLLALGASVGVFDAVPVWEALLAHGVRSAGLRGVKRLYARAPTGSVVEPALKALAWSAYAAEIVFAAYDLSGGSPAPQARPQEPSDTWAIHQLYNAAVPREVQYAEAFTSHRWDLRGRQVPAGSAVSGWLIEEGHHLIGYGRSTSAGGSHMLELVYHPERADVLPALLRTAIAGLPAPRARRVYCAARGYQAEMATALAERGFSPVLEQELHVKYTTATVRLPAGEPVPFHVEVREKLPQRVPTFLHGQPRDESAT